MKKKKLILIIMLILLFGFIIYGYKATSVSVDKSNRPSPVKYIAHAGGRINGMDYTNSKEAIENSYKKGYKLIELDMEWSADDNLVLVHDWEYVASYTNSTEQRVYSDKEFKDFKIADGITTMNIDDLADWLKDKQDVYIVTDVKNDNIQALKLISERYPKLKNRFIPQIYEFEEYAPVKKMGYKDIIITFYSTDYTDEEIIKFVKKHDLFSVTLPYDRATTNLPTLLMKENVFTYMHTVNTEEEMKEIEDYNIKGFYIDNLTP